MADGTEVEPTQLITFSGQLGDALMPFAQSLATAMSDIAEGSTKLGVTNIPEAATVRLYHQALVQQTGHYVGDAATGLQALGQGALTIAANYLAADDAQARGMNSVNAAFAPQPGQQSVSAQQAATRAASAAQDESYAQQIAANRGTLPPAQAEEDRTPEEVAAEDQLADESEARGEEVSETIEANRADEDKWGGAADDQLLTHGTPYERMQAAQD